MTDGWRKRRGGGAAEAAAAHPPGEPGTTSEVPRATVSDLMLKALVHAALAALILGILSTVGDFVWEHWSLRHRVVSGLVHGAVICLWIGAVIGLRAGKPLAGIAVGLPVGVLAAGVFYVLAPVLRWNAMFPAWMLFWICFGVLQARISADRALAPALARASVGAVLSGVAFYLVSGMWTSPPPGGPNYPMNLVNWTFAFFPGFAALFWSEKLETKNSEQRA